MTYIIGDYNRKGGVGKTSTVINIAAQFAMNGKRVLLVDGDSQMNLTQFFFEGDEDVYDEAGELKEDVETLYEVLDQDLNIFNVIRRCEFSTKRKIRNKFKKLDCVLDIVPGSHNMDYYAPEEDRITILKEKLIQISDLYDYIFIDFPPAHSIGTMMYLVACDYIIVPLHLAKNSSIHGYREIIGRCVEAREEYGNTNLEILGLYYNNVQMYKADQTMMYNESMEEETRDAMMLFQSYIRHDYSSVQISEGLQEPICICCGNTEIAKDYVKLVNEIETRIKERE